jgi:hypothetical protein
MVRLSKEGRTFPMRLPALGLPRLSGMLQSGAFAAWLMSGDATKALWLPPSLPHRAKPWATFPAPYFRGSCPAGAEIGPRLCESSHRQWSCQRCVPDAGRLCSLKRRARLASLDARGDGSCGTTIRPRRIRRANKTAPDRVSDAALEATGFQGSAPRLSAPRIRRAAPRRP